MNFFTWMSKGIQSIFRSDDYFGRGYDIFSCLGYFGYILLVSFCIIWIMIHEGGTNVVENLLETCLIVAASLLGISSITGIFKGNQEVKVNQSKKSDSNKE